MPKTTEEYKEKLRDEGRKEMMIPTRGLVQDLVKAVDGEVDGDSCKDEYDINSSFELLEKKLKSYPVSILTVDRLNELFLNGEKWMLQYFVKTKNPLYLYMYLKSESEKSFYRKFRNVWVEYLKIKHLLDADKDLIINEIFTYYLHYDFEYF